MTLTGKPERFESYHANIGSYFEVKAYRPAEGQFAAVFHDIMDLRERGALVEARTGKRFQSRPIHLGRSDADRRSVVAGRKRPAGGGNNGEISATRHSPFAEIGGGTPPLVAPGPST